MTLGAGFRAGAARVAVAALLTSTIAVVGLPGRAMSEGQRAGVESVAPTGTCTGLPPQRARTAHRAMSHHGFHRTYLVHVPPGYDPTTPTPVVLLFHGQGSYGLQQLLYSDYAALADRERFVIVAPDTAYPLYNQWLIGSGPGGTPQVDARVDDVGFVEAVLDRITARFCVDTDRVHATGISSGAFMVSYLACRLPDRIASMVTVAGTVYSDGEGDDTCGERPVPVLAFHGSADRNVPFDHQTFGAYGPNDGVVPQLRQWSIRRNGCAGSTSVTRLAADVTLRSWSCPERQAVKLVRIQGGGHTWPGAVIDVPALGATTHSVSATRMGWRFFASHPLT